MWQRHCRSHCCCLCAALRDCCCLFNPCYWFQEELLYEPFSRPTESSNPFYHVPDEHHVEKLPPQFDAMQEYYNAFHTLDSVVSDALSQKKTNTSCSTRDINSIFDEARLMSASVLSQDSMASQKELKTAFNRLLMDIHAMPENSIERELLIRDYEKYREYHSANDSLALNQATLLLAEAQSSELRTKERILAYQKCIYYTHRSIEKSAVKAEYRAFCQSLKK